MAETPAENPEAPQTLGTRLREAREQRGLSVHQVAQDLHVDDNIIVALEADEYAVLGVPIFVRGHLRNYAQLLGLPADELIATYDHAAKRLASPRLVTMKPEGSPAARRAGLQIFSVLVIAVLVALAVIWWYHRTPAGSVSLFTSSAPTVAAPDRGTAGPARSGQVTRVPLAVPETAAAGPSAVSHGTATVAGSASAQLDVPKSVGQAPTAAAPAGPVVHAQFVVTQASWIEVYDASGKKLFYNLAPAGDKLTLSGSAPLQVYIGNAPGVSIELNGAAFNFSKFTQPNNTAHFRLGVAVGPGGQPG